MEIMDIIYGLIISLIGTLSIFGVAFIISLLTGNFEYKEPNPEPVEDNNEKLGRIESINGIEPEENGNIQFLMERIDYIEEEHEDRY